MAEQKKTYISPTIDIQSKDGKGNFFVRLCYGYVGRYKDTSKMTTQEVIEEFLKRKGVSSPKEFFDKRFSQPFIEKNKINKSTEYYLGNTEKIFDEFRKSRQKMRHEEAVVCDKNGNIVSDKKGNNESVGYTQYEAKKFKGGQMIHNHPQGKTFLSDADIDFALKWDMKSIEAQGFDGDSHIFYVNDYIEQPNANDYEDFFDFKKQYDKWQNQQKRIRDFLTEYSATLNKGIFEADKIWQSLPKQKIKTGKYFVQVPVGWETYTKGASPRDKLNYPKFAEIIQKYVIEFSKNSRDKYGITSDIRKG